MRGRGLLPFVAVAAAGVFGAWLTGMFETAEAAAGDVSGWDNLLSLAGFFIFLGSLVAGVFLLRRLLPPVTRAEMVGWGAVRDQGRSRFVRAGVVRGLLVGLCSLVALVLWDSVSGEPVHRGPGWGEIAVYPLLLLIIVIGSWYSAVRVWAANEDAYRKLMGDAPAEVRAEPTPHRTSPSPTS
jgi:hypothetical protein